MQTRTINHAISIADLRKATGSHYTPKILADFVAKQIVKFLPRRETLRVLDPAVGDGELLFSLLAALTAYAQKAIEVSGFDTNEVAVEIAKSRIEPIVPASNLNLEKRDFVDFAIDYRREMRQRQLFNQCLRHFDVIIANPPYVRTQALGAARAQDLAQMFELKGRVDLYHVFLSGISAVLRPGGIAGVIVSNRFMTTRAGAEIRRLIKEEFDILHVWDLGDTQIFEAAVLPAVLLLKKKEADVESCIPNFSSIYTNKLQEAKSVCLNVIEALDEEGVVRVGESSNFLVQHGVLDSSSDRDGVWRLATTNSDEWLARTEKNTFCRFGDIGKIRVGVKTTADKVFIRDDWDSLPTADRPELLVPLISHHVARRYRARTTRKNILYPHCIKNGKRSAVDLSEFPRSANYLNSQRSALGLRDYLVKSGRQWYEIWVPQDPSAWSRPKIVFRDITSEPTFWMDLSGAIVNGDCYWLTNDYEKDEDILWLCLAVGNSSFIEEFYDHSFNNKLYSGRRRFMTQYVEKFPVPDPRLPSSREIVKEVKNLYERLSSELMSPEEMAIFDKYQQRIDRLVWESFGFK